ncbi:hypothetical protein BJ170DRAFT_684046 [Xylariales sp. AK1849]|nr:hypothetical protein BJ170DRAFT_684046 [Xylariales sp. AK1849]
MDTTRIYVKNLPPTLTEGDFRKVFSKGSITDIKLIPQRRIGYVGYKTSDEAKQAVRHFHRSFIRMSKISVELARPVTDPSLYKVKHPKSIPQASESSEKGIIPQVIHSELKSSKKRKHGEVDESDPKLREFLDVMRNGKASANKLQEVGIQDAEKPTAVEAEPGDDEYQDVPSRQAKRVTRETMAAVAPLEIKFPDSRINQTSNAAVTNHSDSGTATMRLEDRSPVDGASAVVTDDDTWLRSRTSRLLDLMQDDEMQADNTGPVPTAQQEPELLVAEPLEPGPSTRVTEDERYVSDEPGQQVGGKDVGIAAIRSSRRLYLRNLAYTATEDEIRQFFEKYGEIEEVNVPANRSAPSNNQGFAFVLFVDPESAVDAFQQLDGRSFQGRMIHIIPASAKREQLDEFAISKLSLKEQARLKKKAKAGASFNWNSLYMSQDAVLESTADRLQISKAELLDPTDADAAVKTALAEASVIGDTKAYFIANGVDINSFKSPKSRGAGTSVLVKNFSFQTKVDEIRNLFQDHGQVIRVLMPPTGTIAIVQFATVAEAKSAFAKLAYRRFKNSVLFLERGPENLFVDKESQQNIALAESAGVQKVSAGEFLEASKDEEQVESNSSLFVRNLNFSTTTSDLSEAFQHLDGFKSAVVKTKTDPKKPGQVLSMGFGFVHFSSKASAVAAVKSMDGQGLQGHKLLVRASHRGHDAAEERRREDAARKAAGQRTKIVVKNLPFEATKKDIRTLMGSYGQLRSVRLPQNIQHRSKGYAFTEFTTSKEAESAYNALKDTHLLGRRLVLEYADAEELDPEEVISKMSKKTEGQSTKVSLHQLTGAVGRKKLNLGEEGKSEGEFAG